MKRPSLTEKMKAIQGDRLAARIVTVEAAFPINSTGEGRGQSAALREGKKKATLPLSAEDHRRLKRLSADTGNTMEELMVEAVTDLFTKHGA